MLSPTLVEALDMLPDAVSILDHEFRIRYLNRTSVRYLEAEGLDAGQLIGAVYWEALPSARGGEWEHALRRAVATGDIVVFERHAPALGRWMETRIVPSATLITSYTRDMTERHEAERRAAESRALLDAILNNTTDAVFVKDLEGRYLAINEAGAAALHRSAEQVIGLTNFDMLDATVASRLRENELEVLRTGAAVHQEDLMQVGTERAYFLASRGVWRDAQGEIGGIVGIATEITARRRREEANSLLAEAGRVLAESLDYRTTLNTVAHLVIPTIADWCMVVLRSEEGRLETLAVAHADPERARWAREASDRYPFDPESPTGVANVIRTGHSELHEVMPADAVAAGAHDEEHLEILREVDVRSVMIVPMQAHGRTLGALMMIAGESGRTFTADDLPIAEEIARRGGLAIENAELFRAAAAANRTKSEFLASMSHELRTPLNAILGYTQLLSDGITGPVIPAQHDQLMRIRASALHLLGMIDEVLSYSRMEAGREQLTPQEVEAAAVIEESASLVRPMAAAKRLPLLVEVPAETLRLQTDILKLRQILVNLATNAVKFTDEGSVTISVEADGPDVVFQVRDTGIGIPAPHLERVFEPFWQVEQSASRRVGGTGLGLSVSRRLARLLGGDVTVDSEPGAGSTFRVRLPRGLPLAP